MTIQVEDVNTDVTIDCACGRPAKLIALRHLVDDCNGPLTETPDGGEVQPVCVGCARLLHEVVVDDLTERLYEWPSGVEFACRSCSRPIVGLHSVLEWELI